MKLHDTDIEGTGCCGTQEASTSCCQAQVEEVATGCCGNPLEGQDAADCCGAGQSSQGGCCSAQMEEEDWVEEAVQREPCCKTRDHASALPNEVQEHDCRRDRMVELETMLTEVNDKYVRLYSDFDNLKKRSLKERMELSDRANERTLKALLPIVDDFERSIAALQEDPNPMQQAMQVGIELIYDKLTLLLKKFGVESMSIASGNAFDPDLHEAIMQQPVAESAMKGKIISVVEKGYLMNEYILRFAKVVIGV